MSIISKRPLKISSNRPKKQFLGKLDMKLGSSRKAWIWGGELDVLRQGLWYNVENWEHQNKNKDSELGDMLLQYKHRRDCLKLLGRIMRSSVWHLWPWCTAVQWLVSTQGHSLPFLPQPAFSSTPVSSASWVSAKLEQHSYHREKRQPSKQHADMLEAWDFFPKMTSSRTEDLSSHQTL